MALETASARPVVSLAELKDESEDDITAAKQAKDNERVLRLCYVFLRLMARNSTNADRFLL